MFPSSTGLIAVCGQFSVIHLTSFIALYRLFRQVPRSPASALFQAVRDKTDAIYPGCDFEVGNRSNHSPPNNDPIERHSFQDHLAARLRRG
ncbi:hypothetical protein BCR44DRAFT_1290992 [Catenaria anguillulae PL171]|uniref:Uncharacterized protein n=1 Tax=Catenaria anguillulae PL171 TaxID=765915 RepID=A0A1Y2H9G2_9FUNG|nr:hypothetical protein BCR44DRAFT_1290992 [Catenaria anguillulae PL171]